MLHFIIKITICCCALFSAQLGFADKMYYENQDLNKLAQQYDSLLAPVAPHVQKILTIQTNLVLLSDIKLYDKVLKIFNATLECIKPAVLQGIVNVKGQNIEINKGYALTPLPMIDEINNFTYIFPSDNVNDMTINTTNTDYLWAAFGITGNQDYLMKIIIFLNQFSLKIRTLGEELKNREVIDRVMSVGAGSTKSNASQEDLLAKLSQEEWYEVVTYKIISWSLESNMKRYPAVNSLVEKIFKKDKSLTFYRDVRL